MGGGGQGAHPPLAVSDKNFFILFYFFRERRPFPKNSGLNPMSFWVLEVGYPVAPRGPAIVKTGTTVCNNQRGLKFCVDLKALTPYRVSKKASKHLEASKFT